MDSHQKTADFIIILLFLMAICIPFGGSLISKDQTKTYAEKRKLATLPDLPDSLGSLAQYPGKFERYYDDQFGFREPLVKFYNIAKYMIGDSPSDNVLIGKNDWLYLKGGKRGRYYKPIQDYRHITQYSPVELDNFASALQAKKDWLERQGIKYLFVIAPNKHTIYPEYLPDYLTQIRPKSACDQLYEYLNQNTELSLVDLRDQLKAQKSPKHLLYYKTDTHWNELGLNFVQFSIASEIFKMFSGQLKPVLYPYSDFSFVIKRDGDLAQMMGLQDFLQETEPRLNGDKRIKVLEPEGRQPITVSCDNASLRALVSGDSFFEPMIPTFSKYFREITYSWDRADYENLSKFLKLGKPDIVIEELTERKLPEIQPDPYFVSMFHRNHFEKSDEKVFELTASNRKHFKFHKDAHRCRNVHEPGGLCLRSTGGDPIIVLPDIHFKPNQDYVIRVDINAPQKTIMQLFFSKAEFKGHPFNKNQSIRHGLNKGDNIVYLPLNAKALGKKLRLDPGLISGQYLIEALVIKKVTKRAVKRSERS